MTAPIWMALAPEVHSTLLSSGPGPGPLLSAAAAWSALSAEYAAVADELAALVAGVRAGVWEGPAAESYVAANVPYVAWLLQASADSAAAAAQHATAAAAYTTAVAAMPTLVELAVNHTVHGVLVATNFFGLNTIPIALNEADYVRMWVQAATTMSTYQAVSTAAVVASPQTTAAPQIVKSEATIPFQRPYPNPTNFSQVWADLWYDIPYSIETFQGPTDPTTWAQFGQFWSVTAANLSGTPAKLASLLSNPSVLFSYPTLLWVLDFIAGRVFDVLVSVKFLIEQPLLYVVGLGVAITSLGGVVSAASGFAGLAGLASLGPLPTGAEMMPVTAPPAGAALAPAAPIFGSPASVPATIPATTAGAAPAAPAPSATVVAGAPPAPPPPGPGGFPYLAGGMGVSSAVSASAKTHKPKSDAASAAAPSTAAAAEEQHNARRRRRVKVAMLGRGYEYMDLDDELSPGGGAIGDQNVASRVASQHGAGTLGFTGTVRKPGAVPAAGLTALAGGAFGGGPTLPMVPHSWGAGESGEA
ncbi:PPE family protein [Mycobacterium sp. pUA109]|uniref:PPE family protein n=1 Tax=Mycobacterium sp. pUA109 TaxID=3238982 RepID=UPI00351B5677